MCGIHGKRARAFFKLKFLKFLGFFALILGNLRLFFVLIFSDTKIVLVP